MLITMPNLEDAEGVYEALMAAHRDLDPATSRRLDARLVLLLANHIGDAAVLRAAIAAAVAGEAGVSRSPADARKIDGVSKAEL